MASGWSLGNNLVNEMTQKKQIEYDEKIKGSLLVNLHKNSAGAKAKEFQEC